jgi:hypothetical protein
MAIFFVAAIGFWQSTHARATFPAFLAGTGRPLLPSMIDYSVFFPVGCGARVNYFRSR